MTTLATRLTDLATAVGADIKSINGKLGTTTLEPWHIVGAVGEPPFENGWINYGTPVATCGFRKYPDGKVKLRGFPKNGTSPGRVFTLPVGYRPPAYVQFPVVSSGGLSILGYVQIFPDGSVNVGGNNGGISLDVAEFDTETVTQWAVGPQGPAGPQGIPGSSVMSPLDTVHLVGAVGEPAFQGGWTNYGPTYQPLGFRKGPDGKVLLKGLITGGTYNSVICTLPVGYRPPKLVICDLLAYVGGYTVGRIDIAPDGTITSYIAAANPNYLSVDGVVFDTETVTQYAVGPKGDKGDKGDTGGNATVPMDPWHMVGAVGQPAFANSSWKNYGSGLLAVGYRKDPLGRVHLKGVLGVQTAQIAPGTAIFTLPVGYRPPANIILDARAGSGAPDTNARVDVLTDGTVFFQNIGSSSPAAVGVFISLEDLDFDTESVTEMPTGPQGPKGDPGGITGLMKDLDDINSAAYTPFRSRLLFHGPNFKYTDGGPADPFGGGDYTQIEYLPSRQVGGALPGVNIRQGTLLDLVVSTSPRIVWRFQYNSGWEFIGGPPLTYDMKGENSAYVPVTSGQVVTVNAGLSKILQWQYTPPVDVWVDLEFFLGLVAKMDAAYNYSFWSTQCSPAPAIIGFDRIAYRTQHSSVQQYENYTVRARYGLSAGVAYTMSLLFSNNGGTWQYFQGAQQLNMTGRAWPR